MHETLKCKKDIEISARNTETNELTLISINVTDTQTNAKIYGNIVNLNINKQGQISCNTCFH